MEQGRAYTIERAIAFVRNKQAPDGGFVSFSSPNQAPFTKAKTYHTTFAPAILLNALVTVPTAQPITNRLAAWLIAQRSDTWAFNYWAVHAPERTRLAYPDDLDDTACALIGLRRHDPTVIDGAVLGAVVKLLLATETEVGGPYRTWLVPPDSERVWLDVDLAVNCNVAFLLRLVDSSLPSLDKLMDHAITHQAYHSPYYPTVYPLWYYVARAYKGTHANRLAHHIQAAQTDEGHWGTPLRTALALSSLRSLHQPLPKAAVQYLIAAQQPNGSWPAEAYCIDPAQKGKTHYHGAAVLTTALVIEALHEPPAPPTATVRRKEPQGQHMYTTILSDVRTDLTALPSALRTESLAMLDHMERLQNSREIILLPYLFAQSLMKPPPAHTTLFARLGTANLFGWMAYTIYDDFLDDEGNTRQLSVANAALRRSLLAFMHALPEHAGYQASVLAAFDTIDSANAWELANARFTVSTGRLDITALPDYGSLRVLAERSMGHTLTPLGVLASVGIAPTDPSATHITNALAHYIIARQLSDDVHDWQDDIHAGHSTYVITRILQDMNIQPGRHNLKTLMPAMQRYFWHHTLTALCGDMTYHLKLARSHARQSGVLTPKNCITELCHPIEESVAITLHEQKQAKQFLRSYTAT